MNSNKRVRVLHIIKSLGRGGAEMLLPETIRIHDKIEFEFHCIYFLPWKNQLIKNIKDAGGKVECFNASNNLLILFRAFKLIKYVKKEEIDVIHCHLPWAGFVGRIVHKLSGIPVIYSEHNKQERYHLITAFINKITFNWQSQAIAVSEDVKASISKNIHPKIQVQTILNGVNTDRFNRAEYNSVEGRKQYGIGKDDPIIGNVAVFRNQKRLDRWLDEAAKIKLKFPNAHFVLIGDGPNELLVRSKITDLNLTDSVHLPGRLEEVRPWLSTFDIFMISSEFEGLPIALLEAMSMAVPVVATNAGGIKEVIIHNENGLLVDVDDIDLLSQNVCTLLSDGLLKEQLGEAGRNTVIKDFSIQRMVKALEAKYRELAQCE